MFCVLTEKLEAFYRNVVQNGTKREADYGHSRGDVMSFCLLPEMAARHVIRGTNYAFFLRKKAFICAGAAAACFLTTSHSHKR